MSLSVLSVFSTDALKRLTFEGKIISPILHSPILTYCPLAGGSNSRLAKGLWYGFRLSIKLSKTHTVALYVRLSTDCLVPDAFF